MYNRLSIKNSYHCNYNNNNDRSRIFQLKYTTNKHHQTLIYNKIDKINKLDRTILNQQMEVNQCSLTNNCEADNKNMSIRKLSLLKDLKTKWEKELLYMYFEEI